MKVVVLRHIPRKWMKTNREIIDLAKAAAYQIIEEIDFYDVKPHPQNFVPEMKLQDLLFLIEEYEINKIIIDGYIKPHQMQALEELTGKEILDKPMLVLEIFSNKANTRDIQLQIQLAQLKYSIPRTRAKVGEAVRSERPGFGGTGEQVTDILVSDIKKRIRKLEARLEEFKKKFNEDKTDLYPILPIIGFYSAGKSTLFNILTDNNRETSEEAFTTMILKTGRTKLIGYPIDLIDTIGLVDLPSVVLNSFDLMLNSIFSFSGMIMCLDGSLTIDHWKEQLEDLNMYFTKFAKVRAVRVIIVLTKVDLATPETIKNMKEIIQKQEWLEKYIIFETRKDKPQDIKQEFIKVFEELFDDLLVHFSLSNLDPGQASKIHNIARIENQVWQENGKSFLKGVAPKLLYNKLQGEIFK